jgi:ATP-dependent Lon protease
MAEEQNPGDDSVIEARPPDREAKRITKLTMLPLRDVVVFPYMVIPLFVGRQKSLKAIDMAMKGSKEILVSPRSRPRPTTRRRTISSRSGRSSRSCRC